MAQTAGSNFPIEPGTPSGDGAVRMSVIPIDTSETTMRTGDILCVVAATNDVREFNNADGVAAAERIIGVAMLPGRGEISVTGTIDRDAGTGPSVAGTISTVNVALALPGAGFTGNIVTATSNETGEYVANVYQQMEITETTQGFGALDNTSASGSLVAHTMAYTSPQYLVSASRWQHGRLAGVNIINPRAHFVFITAATVFGNSAPL